MDECFNLTVRLNPAFKLVSFDLRILVAVQENARSTKLALAEKAGLSAPCWLRLRKLEEASIVTGYHAHISYRKIVPIENVIVQITLGNHRQSDFDRFERAFFACLKPCPAGWLPVTWTIFS